MRRPPLGRLGLPVLPNVHVASPCPADWSKMTGDERVRMCGQCSKHVFNLSQMTRSEAEELVIEKHGNLCVRYFQRTDGTILLKDCTVAASSRKRQMILAGAAALLATGGGLAALMMPKRDVAAVPTIAAPPTPVEIDWRIHEQEMAKQEAPPVVIAPPPELELKEDWHVTGGAVAMPMDDDDFKEVMGER